MFASMGNTKTTLAKAARRSREQWVAEIASWRKSGLGSAEYAQQRGLNRGTLLGWSFKVGAMENKPATRRESSMPARFLPVRVRAQAAAKVAVADASRIEIVLTNGRVVRVAGAVDAGELARVLAAAEGAEPC
jgi:hypothetical protein